MKDILIFFSLMMVSIFIFVFFFSKNTNENICKDTVSVINTLHRDVIICHNGSVSEIVKVDNLILLKCNCPKNPDAGID